MALSVYCNPSEGDCFMKQGVIFGVIFQGIYGIIFKERIVVEPEKSRPSFPARSFLAQLQFFLLNNSRGYLENFSYFT